MLHHALRTAQKSAPVAVPVTFQAAYTNIANQPSYTFTGCAIGAAAADRLVIVAVEVGQTAGSITGCTIGGAAATLLAYSGTGNVCCAIFALVVASGTTATVVVNTAGVNRCAIEVYAAYNLASATPVATLVQYSAADTDGLGGTIAVSAGGFVVACFGSQTVSSTLGVIWTGVDQDYSDHVETQRYTSASLDGLASEAARSISAARSDGTHAMAIAAISMR